MALYHAGSSTYGPFENQALEDFAMVQNIAYKEIRELEQLWLIPDPREE